MSGMDANQHPMSDAEPWPVPEPLPGLPEVAPFDARLLPESLRAWLVDIAERMQCPVDFPAVAAVVVMAALVGRKIGIRPKRMDDWLVVPNLWGGIIGRPSLMKTPALAEPLKVLKRFEIEARDEHDDAIRQAEVRKLVAKARERERSGAIRKAIKEQGEAEAEAIAAEWLATEEGPPPRKRILLNDPTMEKLGEILNENPNGVLVFRDELTGLLRNLEKEGQEGARAFYLEAWNGTGRYTFDRIGRGTLDIDAACVSILGGIQPGPLREYVRACDKGGRGDDGLLQRFQVLVWPDAPAGWQNVDRWPDKAAKDRAWAVYQRLHNLAPLDYGKADNEGDIPYCRFANDAQDCFDEWRIELEHRVRIDGERDCFIAHLTKYRSLVPSLALLFHLADGQGAWVNLTALQQAIGWAEYLETHARRLYGAAVDPGQGSAKALAAKITGRKLADGFSLKDVYRPQWSGLTTRDDAAEAVDVLADMGWLRPEEKPTEGRTATVYRINPRLFDKPASANEKSKESPGDTLPELPKAPSGSFGSAISDASTAFHAENDELGQAMADGDWGAV